MKRPLAACLNWTVCLIVLMIVTSLRAAEPVPPAPISFKAPYATVGKIDRLDPELDRLVPPDAKIEKLATGFLWSEGPVWSKVGGYLLFSDVKRNTVFKWQEGAGITEFLHPSGYFGTARYSDEPGSNGLTFGPDGALRLCEHGERRVARLNKDKTQTAIADHFEGKRFNSPNDLIFDSQGNLFFTDPPYGLPGTFNSPAREMEYRGVFRVAKDGKASLVIKDLNAPNGIALSPDEKTLYIAQSDPSRAVWMAYDLRADRTVSNGRVLLDVTPLVKKGLRGLPDGMKVDREGNLFAAGPGGILVITPQGKHLGTIMPGEVTANCAWGDDGHTLYMCNNMNLIRIRLATSGKQP